ncbi:MAG: CPBP family intramembrane metalloprotease [Saprospirales bacterium]|nr:MAG: CPBP family intramembrane metalloprotease [Saprospirales bacterium]
MEIDFRNPRVLGYITIIGFGLSGVALIWFVREESVIEFLRGHYSFPVQILTGLIYGLVCGYAAWFIVQRRFMRGIYTKYRDLIRGLNLSIGDVWFLSFCAGFGEELFFRGGLQPLLGIWITAIIFVAIHGYLNPMNWRITIYGIAMCFFIAGMGYLTEEVGILSAAVAHMMVDVVLLKKLAFSQREDVE